MMWVIWVGLAILWLYAMSLVYVGHRAIEREKRRAIKFVGYQESRGLPPMAMFQIHGHDQIKEGDTVLLETLRKHGIEPPEFKTYAQWKWDQGEKYPNWAIINGK